MFTEYITERTAAFQALSPLEDRVQSAAGLMIEVLKKGGKVMTCGNGGSAAEAQHLSTELIGRFKAHRRSLPSISLNADGSTLTCIANDFGPEQVFSRQLEGFARPDDCLVAFSSSGNSQNIVKVLETASSLGISSIALLGRDGGRCRGLSTHEIIVPSQSTAVIQELHLFLLHFLCERIEEAFA